MAKKFMPHMRMSVMARAIAAFDRASGVIIATIWGSAIVLSILANISVGRALSAREELAQAEASIPLTPNVTQVSVPPQELADTVEKLQKRYGTVLQVMQKKGDSIVTILSKDPTAFSTWLTAITYLDIIRPDIAWKIDTLCVGVKCGDTIMSGTFSARSMRFEIPQPEPTE